MTPFHYRLVLLVCILVHMYVHLLLDVNRDQAFTALQNSQGDSHQTKEVLKMSVHPSVSLSAQHFRTLLGLVLLPYGELTCLIVPLTLIG